MKQRKRYIWKNIFGIMAAVLLVSGGCSCASQKRGQPAKEQGGVDSGDAQESGSPGQMSAMEEDGFRTEEQAKPQAAQPETQPKQPEIQTEQPKTQTEQQEEQAELELLEKINEKYYANWTDEAMNEEIIRRKQYLQNCAFYDEVSDYMEHVMEIRDVSGVVQPLYLTDMKYYKADDFAEVPAIILHIARNEIYARHGYIFQDEDLYNYFMGQIWYEPTCKPEDFKEEMLNEYEKENLKLIIGLEK